CSRGRAARARPTPRPPAGPSAAVWGMRLGRSPIEALRARPYLTTIVPVIEGWMVQWYGKFPVVLNVRRNVAPGASVRSQSPVSDVVVWVVVAVVFFHTTVVPAMILSVLGMNAKLTTATPFVTVGVLGVGAACAVVRPSRSTTPRSVESTRLIAVPSLGRSSH